MNRALIILILYAAWSRPALADESAPDFHTHVAPLLAKYCNGCHNADDAEGKLVLESYDKLLAGGGRGPAVVPGRSDQSRLVLMLDGRVKPQMPPEGSDGPSEQEIAIIKAWIDAGAKSPTGAAPDPTRLATPHVPLLVERPRESIHAVAFSPDGAWLALASYGRVRVVDAQTHDVVAQSPRLRGHVNDVAFSADGKSIVAAAGEPGLFGEVQIWTIGSTEPAQMIVGHRDALYALTLVPGGKLLATGSYDEQVRIWDASSGQELRRLSGHNGPVFGLSASPDGRLLASASGDRTVKIWDLATGERLDTLGQSLKELFAVAFNPAGTHLAAAGSDNRIRVWRIGKSAREGDNPLLHSRFAHEGALVRLAWSPDGRWLASSAEDLTVKIWHADSLVEHHLLEKQSDTPAAMSFSPDSKSLLVGRLDGSYQSYDVESGQPRPAPAAGKQAEKNGGATLPTAVADLALAQAEAAGATEGKDAAAKPPAKPELSGVDPRGIQRGKTVRVTLVGKHLQAASAVTTNHDKLAAILLDKTAGSKNALTINVTAAADIQPGSYELSVTTPGGASGKVRLHVDDIAQQNEQEPNNDAATSTPISLPVSCWGTLAAQGDTDHFSLEATAGETVVLDVAAQSIGSKLNAVLTLLDPDGRVVQANNDFDGQSDPLLAFTVPRAGRYSVRISDLSLAGSKEHFYRLSAGRFPYVTACFPLGVPAGQPSTVELIGYNLPAAATAQIPATERGEAAVPIDIPGHRSRRDLKVVVGKFPETRENEPNDQPAQANAVTAPGTVNGRIDAADSSMPSDVDLFRFECAAGERYIIETEAAQRGSPIDTRIEVLDGQGQPVERMLLQATRDSTITFRGIDSQINDVRVTNWEEMELNELLYMQGEVCKLFRLPQGPDSGFNFYALGGKRRTLFDTSPTTHAVDEPCYIVEPHPPGAKLVANGLPVFPLYYANDDDGDRKLGRDSRLTFTAPRSGAYLARVQDVRQQGGDRYAYRLTLRKPEPAFAVTLGGANPTITIGSGKGFTLTADRQDGFEGAIEIDVQGLPNGLRASTPLSIEAGHVEARGVLFADKGAVQPTSEQLAAIKIVARGMVDGKTVEKAVNGWGKIALESKPSLTAHLEPAELSIAPGTTISATLRVERNGFKDRVQLSVDNLPHGVIVDNIGLNGVLIPEGKSERQIFLTARDWVPETTRPFHAVATSAGAQASAAVLLHVRKDAKVAQSASIAPTRHSSTNQEGDQ